MKSISTAVAPSTSHHSTTVFVSALFVAAALFGANAVNARSQTEVPVTAGALAELEKAFWACDYAATTRGVDENQAILCGAATQELKRVKFGGDFDKLVDWWRVNKPAMFLALDLASAAAMDEDAVTDVHPD